MKNFAFELLDWCGEHEALLIAVAGFISSMAIAKITSGLEIRKVLCMHRFEAYEKAISHLSLKINVYYNIQAAIESLKGAESSIEVLKSKVVILVLLLARLGEIEKEDINITGASLYTVFPYYDAKPLTKELAHFVARLQDFSCCANLPNSEERLRRFAPVFKEDVEQIAPMVEKETNHLNAIYAQLKDEISKDKMAKKLFRKS